MSDVDPNVKGADKEESGSIKQEDIAKMVNAAITSHLKRLDFDTKISTALETALTPFKESMSAKKEPTQATSQSVDPQVLELRKQLEVLQKTLKEKDEKVAMQAKTSREKEAFSQLKTLVSGKVRPEAVDAVSKLLFHADKKISVSEDGQMSWVDGENEIDVESGLKQYLKSKEAAIYLPAPNSTASKSVKKPDQTGLMGMLRTESTSADPLPKGNATEAAAMLAKLGLKL